MVVLDAKIKLTSLKSIHFSGYDWLYSPLFRYTTDSIVHAQIYDTIMDCDAVHSTRFHFVCRELASAMDTGNTEICKYIDVSMCTAKIGSPILPYIFARLGDRSVSYDIYNFILNLLSCVSKENKKYIYWVSFYSANADIVSFVKEKTASRNTVKTIVHILSYIQSFVDLDEYSYGVMHHIGKYYPVFSECVSFTNTCKNIRVLLSYIEVINNLSKMAWGDTTKLLFEHLIRTATGIALSIRSFENIHTYSFGILLYLPPNTLTHVLQQRFINKLSLENYLEFIQNNIQPEKMSLLTFIDHSYQSCYPDFWRKLYNTIGRVYIIYWNDDQHYDLLDWNIESMKELFYHVIKSQNESLLDYIMDSQQSTFINSFGIEETFIIDNERRKARPCSNIYAICVSFNNYPIYSQRFIKKIVDMCMLVYTIEHIYEQVNRYIAGCSGSNQKNIPSFFLEYLLEYCRREHRSTREKCIVSYEIPEHYLLCTSNVPHIISYEVFTKLTQKQCPYCRSVYDPVVYMNNTNNTINI